MTRITVTQEHINLGEPEHGCECPIALALADIFPSAHVCVTFDHIKIWDHDKTPEPTRIYSTPSSARLFIDAFDAGAEVSPFWFEL